MLLGYKEPKSFEVSSLEVGYQTCNLTHPTFASLFTLLVEMVLWAPCAGLSLLENPSAIFSVQGTINV